jgi:hypothetical protein
MHLGHLGQASIAPKPAAYKAMWESSYEQSQGSDFRNVSPRGEFGDALDNLPDLNGINPVDLLQTVGNVVTAVGGHWMESKAYADFGQLLSANNVHYSVNNTDAANRLNNHFQSAGWTTLTSTVIGTDVNRPKFALDDNMFDEDQNVLNNFGGGGVEGIIRGALVSVFELSGVVPGYLAGIRYGQGTGEAHATVNLPGNWTETFNASYSTSISPRAIDDQAIPGLEGSSFGSFGREQSQYFFYYLMGQTIKNERVTLDIIGQDFDKEEKFDPPTKYGE